MDFGEILSYKPSLDVTATVEEVAEANKTSNKRKRDASAEDSHNDPSTAGPMSDAQRLKLLEMMDAQPEVEELDPVALKKMCLALEKRVTKNTEMRAKYGDKPEKFVDSELALHDEILAFHVVATVPHLYAHIIRLKTTKTLVDLLSHENVDICVAIIGLLQEMTDADSENEGTAEAVMALVASLYKANMLGALVDTIRRFDETNREEAQGIHQALGIFENLMEATPQLGEEILKTTKFLRWALPRVQIPYYDENKLYVSEILAIMTQSSELNRKALCDGDGVEALLHALNVYRKKDPQSAEEIEMMENMFDCLSSVVHLAEAKEKLVKADGVMLLSMMVRAKNLSRRGALKVLSHCTASDFGADVCEAYIDASGLKGLFPSFMKTPAATKAKKSGYTEVEFEEHVCTILSNLLKNVKDAASRARLLTKFVEKNYAKLDRLAELFIEYQRKLRTCEQKLEQEKREMEQNEETIDEDIENDHYLRRIDAGLLTLQMLAYIAAEACFECGSDARNHLARSIHLKGETILSLAPILQEYEESVSEEEEKNLKARIAEIVQCL